MMVSERHNQAYKESMKLFEPLPPEAPLVHTPLISYTPGPDVSDITGLRGHLIHTTTEPLITRQETEYIIDECEVNTTHAPTHPSRMK